jgi:aminopeptidase
MDKRWYQLAEILVNYSTQIKRGERVIIAMHEIETMPLVQAVHEAAIKAGAYVQVQFLSEHLRRSLMRYGSPEQLAWVPEIEAYGLDWADVYLGLRGAANIYEFADINPEILAVQQRALGQISKLRWEKTRWCLVRVPNELFAQQAETDIETMLDFFFEASLRDWAGEAKRWRDIAHTLETGHQLRLIGRETDLSFSVAGRKWLVGDGHINIPDGEIYTAPITETLNGTIYFEFPGILSGRLLSDIRLTWRDGQLVEASASQNQDFLHQIVSADPGASLLGEFGLGVNYGINRFCKDILLDEKIGGTVHVALGRAYPECGGSNVSAIHWDIIKDTRAEGVIYLDEHKVFENGQILI